MREGEGWYRIRNTIIQALSRLQRLYPRIFLLQLRYQPLCSLIFLRYQPLCSLIFLLQLRIFLRYQPLCSLKLCTEVNIFLVPVFINIGRSAFVLLLLGLAFIILYG